MNHIRLSHDPRCTSIRDRLQPTYHHAPEQEPPPLSPTIDVELADLDDMASVTSLERLDHTGAANLDTDMSDGEANDVHPRPMPEKAPDIATHSSNTQAPVVFYSDTEDSDDDDDQTLQSAPPSPRSAMDVDAEQPSQTGKFFGGYLGF